MRNARFLDDPDPPDPDCGCETCRNHSRAYLAHLFRAEELLAYRLSSLHNVTYTQDLMRRIRAGPRRRVVRNAARSRHGPVRALRNEVG